MSRGRASLACKSGGAGGSRALFRIPMRASRLQPAKLQKKGSKGLANSGVPANPLSTEIADSEAASPTVFASPRSIIFAVTRSPSFNFTTMFCWFYILVDQVFVSLRSAWSAKGTFGIKNQVLAVEQGEPASMNGRYLEFQIGQVQLFGVKHLSETG
jgi:hypothetical protein